jgi:hypothetical protein
MATTTDKTKPKLLSSNPKADASGIKVGQNVVLTFDEPGELPTTKRYRVLVVASTDPN